MKFRQTTFFGAAMALNIVLSLSSTNTQAAVSCDVVFSPITQAKIEAAILAEQSAPTITISVRGSLGIEQYTAIDRPELVGKKIIVDFYDDTAAPGANVGKIPVPQMVLTKEYLDPTSQQVVETIKRESTTANGFQEVGAWVIYTDRGAYISDTFTSHDSYEILNRLVFDGFDQALARVQQSEGLVAQIRDIEFYHTHYERGEAFSFGDLSFQQRYFPQKFRKFLAVDGNYAAYAVPIQGNVLFKSSVRKKSQ